MNDLLVASGVAGLIVGLLLVWRYLRRERSASSEVADQIQAAAEWLRDQSQEAGA